MKDSQLVRCRSRNLRNNINQIVCVLCKRERERERGRERDGGEKRDNIMVNVNLFILYLEFWSFPWYFQFNLYEPAVLQIICFSVLINYLLFHRVRCTLHKILFTPAFVLPPTCETQCCVRPQLLVQGSNNTQLFLFSFRLVYYVIL